MALLAQDWAGAAGTADPKLKAVAEQLGAAPPAPAADPYATAKALIEQSRKDRAAIGGALLN